MANKRLIDANEVKHIFVVLSEQYYGSFTGEAFAKALKVLENATTIDAVEVVHGRWISSGCGFDCCSECRKVYTDGYFTAMGIKPREQFNYCPNCGADMRERECNDRKTD